MLFRIIQYIERQVVLVDALEDARYAQLNDMGGAESLQSLMQRVRRHGLEKEMRDMLAEYAVRVVLTSHPPSFTLETSWPSSPTWPWPWRTTTWSKFASACTSSG